VANRQNSPLQQTAAAMLVLEKLLSLGATAAELIPLAAQEIPVGCFCLYLLPTAAVNKPREAIRKAVSVLAEEGIIGGGPTDTPQLAEAHLSFGCGENADHAFDMEAATEAVPFETCFVFGAESPDVVPQCPGVDPSCPKCGRIVSSEPCER
jgi:hypothetical protein